MQNIKVYLAIIWPLTGSSAAEDFYAVTRNTISSYFIKVFYQNVPEIIFNYKT